MNCADFEILLCDYMDGTLDACAPLRTRSSSAGVCRLRGAGAGRSGAVAFMERVPEVEPPHELLAKIAFQIPSGERVRSAVVKHWLAGWLQPIAQPRFAMGMAMTILSFSMLGRFAGCGS